MSCWLSLGSWSYRERVYRVTITNLTRGQVFSPPVIATHRASVGFFELGTKASDELAAMAENGMGAPLAAVLSSKPQVYQARATMTPIGPGSTESFEIRSRSHFDRISVAGMLVNTNDTFFAVDTRSLPERRWQSHTVTAVAYDAGSEFNSEDCNYIPGPACGTMSQERDPGMPEGYVYVSNGIHGLFPDLLPSDHYDWHNPVARVTVQRSAELELGGRGGASRRRSHRLAPRSPARDEFVIISVYIWFVRSGRRVLVIEDDRDIASLVRLHLAENGCDVTTVHDGSAGLARALSEDYDLVVLDLMLPGTDGIEICRRLRARPDYTPILMLTAKSAESDRVVGLEMGADDYLTKPFSVRELVARIKAIFRRVAALGQSDEAASPNRISIDGLTITLDKRRVELDGRLIDLTAKEFDLLVHFASHPGRVYTRAQLLDLVWGYGQDNYQHTVNSHINRLRAKIERDPTEPHYVQTVWGVGYKFYDPEHGRA